MKKKGAVAGGARETAEVAASILEAGGNAFDAAIAGVFASFAAESVFCNPGGAGLCLVREANGATRYFDFFSAMPGKGAPPPDPRTMDFHDCIIEYGDTRPNFRIGRASSAVPGLLKGLSHLHQRYGTIPLKELLQPCLELARRGVPLTKPHIFIAGVLKPIKTSSEETAQPYGGIEGYLANPQAPVRSEALIKFLTILQDEGIESLYSGAMAQAIVRDHEANGGLITLEDLRTYEVLEREPTHHEFDGWSVFLPSLPCLGGMMVGSMIALWRDLDAIEGKAEPYTADFYHRWAVVQEAVNRQRNEATKFGEGFLEKPETLQATQQRLIEMARESLHRHKAMPSGEFLRLPGNTTHLSVLDEAGNALSITHSPGESAGYIIKEIGLAMNNMLGEEDVNPAGFHKEPPGKRLSTMMSPAIAIGHHGGLVVFGSGGTTRIRTAMSQFLVNLIERRMDLRQAILEPRLHYEDGDLQIESHPGETILSGLRKMDYPVFIWEDLNAYFGGVHAVRELSGTWQAEADPRRSGGAVALN